MRVGIFILILMVGFVTSLAVSAADERRNNQGSRPAPQDATKERRPPPSVTVIGAGTPMASSAARSGAPPNEDMGRVVDVIVDARAPCAPR